MRAPSSAWHAAAVVLACWVCLADSSSLRASGMRNARMVGHATAPCDCSSCRGVRDVTDSPSEGFKGFQCKPGVAGHDTGSCRQTGDPSGWVVQTAEELTYERFCLLTCKPIIPKAIRPDVSCEALSTEEVKLQAQSPSGNGRAFIWHSNPMTDSLTTAAFPASDGPKLGVRSLASLFK